MTARRLNGVVSAALAVFFLAHAALGDAWMLGIISGSLRWLVWVGVFGIVAHVAISVVTSVQQVSDKERPASARKKRHLALKWATGALLALAAALHVNKGWLVLVPGEMRAFANAVLLVVVVIALAVHVCVGAKSLLKDLDLDRRHKMAFRVAVCMCAALIVLGILLAQ